MSRARRKPSNPPMPVEWIETEAQNAGCVVEIVEEDGKAPRKRRHRDHLLEYMAKPQRYPGGSKPPLLTYRQKEAGMELHSAWCETQRSPAQSGVAVQNSPDYGAIALGAVERIWGFSEVSAHLPQQYRDVVLNVVVHQIPMPDQLSALRAGLDAVADGLKLN